MIKRDKKAFFTILGGFFCCIAAGDIYSLGSKVPYVASYHRVSQKVG
jgi:hypothetical protein